MILDDSAIISNKITVSLLTYMYSNGVKDITVRIQNEDDKIVIVAEGETDKKPNDLEEFNKLLNMLGIGEDVNDINLLSSMVDEGMILYHEKVLSFYAARHK